MNNFITALIFPLAFGMTMTVSATQNTANTPLTDGMPSEPLIIATDEQSEPTAGGFKRQDPDTIIRNTDDPADVVNKPEPGAEPSGFVGKDPDSIIRETHDPADVVVKPEPGAEPQPFEGKDHSGLDNTPRTTE